MIDQIPADKVEKIAAEMRDAMRREDDGYPYAEFLSDMGDYIKDLEALLPQRPTLADMTDEERAACIRMQCDTAPNRSVRGFIADVYPGGCRVIERDTWKWRSCSDDMVTPRPDLPRMEWPADKKVEDVPPVKVGDVIESADDPRIDALPVGSILSDCDGENVAKRHGEWVGLGYVPIPSEGMEFGPWTVLHIPKEDA